MSLTKSQLAKRFEPFLKDFTLYEHRKEKKKPVTRAQLAALLTKKGYKQIKKTTKETWFAKVWNPSEKHLSRNKNKDILDPKNCDYSLVILAKDGFTEGLVWTKKQQGYHLGLYEAGGVFTLDELHDYITEYR